MGLRLERKHRLHLFGTEKVGTSRITRGKDLHLRTAIESHIILVSRNQIIGVLLGGLLDHLEERTPFLLAINHKGTTKDLVSAVLRIDLRKAKELAIGQRSSHLLSHLLQICHFLLTQCQALRLIVGSDILHLNHLLRAIGTSKDVGAQPLILPKKHPIKRGIGSGGCIKLNAVNP